MNLARMVTLLLACAAQAAPASAMSDEVEMRGLFCDSADSLNRALALIAAGASDAEAAAMANAVSISCTDATLIGYVISDVSLGLAASHGRQVYRANLVAVIVGAARRPVEPPVPVFFYRRHGLPILDGAQSL